MKIAILYDFKFPIDQTREGIGVYCLQLFDKLLEIDKTIKVDVYAYIINIENAKIFFKSLKEKYKSRINFVFPINTNLSFYNKIKIFKYKIKYYFKKNKKYLDKINKIYYYNDDNLIYYAQNSNVDVVYAMHPICNLGLKFKAFHCIQIHDLFTMEPRIKQLFIENNINVDGILNNLLLNINNYLKNNSIIITGSNYVKNNQILKYIENANKDNTIVINYPPIIKDFKDLKDISKKELQNKFNINTKYIFYPTQNRPNKNLIVLLKALKLIKERTNIDIKFITTGKIRDIENNYDFVIKNNISDMILEIGSVSQDDLYYLYKYSDLVVVTTIIEGPGMPQQVLEPLNIGNIPIICGKCLGVEENLKEHGLSFETADLNWFESDDYEKLFNNILDVLENPEKHIIKQKDIIKYYTKITWEDTAKNYLKIFNKNIKVNI